MRSFFRSPKNEAVPAVTAQEMTEVDRIAIEATRLILLQMMENA